jgi:hypothetical protein
MSRKLIFHPALNPASFVLLFTKGGTGQSWSIRDYSEPTKVSIRYAREFPFSLEELLVKASHAVDAPATSTGDVVFWHRLTCETNARHHLARVTSETSSENPERLITFPILNSERLMEMPKSRKANDMKRILTSSNSEDWVTWNTFALAEEMSPNTWWKHLLALATVENPTAAFLLNPEETPRVTLWRSTPTPPLYEAANRARMRASSLPATIARSFDCNPVEGESEIDIVLETREAILFIEAKLGSDISARTTHDPTRNQIVRNIDCLLEVAGAGATPVFWMLVRDRGEMRTYQQLLNIYRKHPSALCLALPHRNPEVLSAISQRLSSILWRDFVSIIPVPTSGTPQDEVYQELLARVQ